MVASSPTNSWFTATLAPGVQTSVFWRWDLNSRALSGGSRFTSVVSPYLARKLANSRTVRGTSEFYRFLYNAPSADEMQSEGQGNDASGGSGNLSDRIQSLVNAQSSEELLRSVAEMTNASPESLRAAFDLLSEQREAKRTKWGRFVQQVRQMSLPARRIVTSAFLGLQAGLVNIWGQITGDPYGLAFIGGFAVVLLAIWNLAQARRKELGVVAGGVLGGSFIIGSAFFSFLFSQMFRTTFEFDGVKLLPFLLLGALAGFVCSALSDRILQLRLQHDPIKRREYLLRQLIELQEELKSGERSVTFLSVDVVGSTSMKSNADPLAVEYSFGEYTKYVTEVASQFDGSVHSTAGDGIMLVFEHPQAAFLASRRLHAGLLEFNAFKNRIGSPFQIRCGIHTGTVVAPAGDAGSVNYSHVIDIAAHVQRAAPPGGTAVSEDAAEYIPGGERAIGTEETDVYGKRVVLWRSHAAPAVENIVAHSRPLPAGEGGQQAQVSIGLAPGASPAPTIPPLEEPPPPPPVRTR